MAALIDAQELLLHSMVIGELALGNLDDRGTRLALFASLPRIEELENNAVLAKIEAHQIMGRGIGFVDAHLVFSALEREGTQLWTRDRRLHQIADELGSRSLKATEMGKGTPDYGTKVEGNEKSEGRRSADASGRVTAEHPHR